MSTTNSGLKRLASVCFINLDHRSDRQAQVDGEFAKLGFDGARRVPGIQHDNGTLGCGLAHISVLELAEKSGWSSIMICEDDITFLVDRARIDRFIDAFLDDPRTDVLCLAFNAFEVEPYNSELQRATNTQTASCYVLKRASVPLVKAIFEEAMVNIAAGRSHNDWAIDQAWKRIQQNHVFVIPVERAAMQRSSFSDILQRTVDYGV